MGQNGYRGEVAKKSRTRGAGTRPARPPRPAAASGSTGAAQTGAAKTGTAQLTPPAARAADQATSKKTESYPGQHLGLPERGPGSVASMPRRVAALFIDWLLSMIIAYWLTRSQFWTIAVFAVEVYVLTALGGSTVGKRLVGIRTVRIGGGPGRVGWGAGRAAGPLPRAPPPPAP